MSEPQLPHSSDPMASDPMASDPMASDPMASDPMASDFKASDAKTSEPKAMDPAASGPAAPSPQTPESTVPTRRVEPPPTFSHPLGVLHEVRWKEICPWLILVKALRVTLLIRVLVFAWLGVAFTHWGWVEIDRFFSFDLAATAGQTNLLGPLDHLAYEPQPLGSQLLGPQSMQELGAASKPRPPEVINAAAIDKFATAPPSWIEGSMLSSSAFFRGWYWLSEPLVRLVDRNLSTSHLLGWAAHGLWAVVVWAIFGSAMSRIAALYLTRGETCGPVPALRDAITIGPSVATAPLIPLLATAAMAVPLILLGLLLRLHLVAVAAGLLWLVVFAWGLMLAVVLLGLLLGWPLMWACLAVERSDAFDGASRCYAYVYQKPHKLAFYVVVAALLACLGEGVVTTFAMAAAKLSESILSWGAGSLRASELFDADWHSSSTPLATRAIHGWRQGLELLTASYPLACLWPFSVGIYLLLRSDIDATEMDEINLDPVDLVSPDIS